MEVTAWHVITGVIGIVLSVLIPVIASINSRINTNSKELSDHKAHVAEFYAKTEHMNSMADRLERHMDKQFQQLRDAINKDRIA